ncbi:MAG TPA: DUF6805 domain-containing protein, partial [Mucilaginibacter sp.]
ISVTYFGTEWNHKFSIWINDRKLANADLSDGKRDTFFSVDYALPDDLTYAPDQSIRVKFVAESGSTAGPVYEVRLLKN